MFGNMLENMNSRVIMFVILMVAAYLGYKHIYLPKYKKLATAAAPVPTPSTTEPIMAKNVDESKEE